MLVLPTLLRSLFFASLVPFALCAEPPHTSSQDQGHTSTSSGGSQNNTGSSQTGSSSSNSVTTSWYQTATLVITNGNRVYTTMSIPVPITITPSSSAGGNSTQKTNSTLSATSGGNGTAIQSTTLQTSSTPTTLPIAPTTIPYGGGGTTVAAPSPGGTGSLPQGPGDGKVNGATQLVVSYLHSIIPMFTIALTMAHWFL